MDRHAAKRRAMVTNLEEATNRPLDEWVTVAADAPVEGFMRVVQWLKDEHGLGHFQARLVVEEWHAGGPSQQR